MTRQQEYRATLQNPNRERFTAYTMACSQFQACKNFQAEYPEAKMMTMPQANAWASTWPRP